ncbi:cobalamin biosynthesis protein [Streptomyces sp. NBC_01186]|uniref:cobalamin biosynthesis protein n=1 Tax=Streptomyces sp. NBC_01186 TaxID=2903765 RepID=UPI002E1674DC|nr:cobalamin biosynthesis protein [Streptomyces sp. NBC_01186]
MSGRDVSDGDVSGRASAAGRRVTIGVGACQGVPPGEVLELVRDVLAGAGLTERDVTALATVTARAQEPGLLAVAERLTVPLLAYDATALARVQVPHPSDFSRTALGTPSVAEAAALLAAGADRMLLTPKTKSRPPHGAPVRATAALALGAPDARRAADARRTETSADPHHTETS